MKKLLFFLSLFFSFVFNSSFAQNFSSDSLKALLSRADDTTRVNVLNQICKVYLSNNQDSSMYYVKQAVALAEKIDFKKGLGNSYNNMGNIYENQGNYSLAMEYHLKSLKIREEVGDKGEMAKSYNNIGISYLKQFNYTLAMEFFFKSLKIREELGDKKGASRSYSNIGLLYTRQGNYSLAQEYYNKSLIIDEELGDKNELYASYTNMGIICSAQKNYDPALEYYSKALKMAEELGNKIGVAALYNNVGVIYRYQENYPLALESQIRSLKIREELGDKAGMSMGYFNIGVIYETQGDYEKAITYYQKTLDISKEIGHKENMSHAYDGLSSAFYKEKKDYKKAYEYHKLYSDIKDTLLNIENSRQIAEINTKYQTEKKDKELIQKDAEITKQQLETKQNATQRNAFIGGFALTLVLGLMILRGYNQKKKAHFEITQQKEIIEVKNKDITDSINYAKRIQKAILPSGNYFKKHLSEYFIFYKPKDIVSGDFYWAFATGDKKVLIATADCTGHGVPGAFMSMIGNSKLNEIVIERKVSSPDEILNQLREEVIKALNPEDAEEESKDGMDISLCSFDFGNMKLQYAGANNSIYLIRKEELTVYKADKFPVGKYSGELKPFTLQEVPLQKGDTVYTFTDGYADQFGGTKGKKFKYKQLQELLISIQEKNMEEQKAILEKSMEAWKANLEQVDDILVIGVRV